MNKKIEIAEEEIGWLLKELEQETGAVVESIELVDLDVTTIEMDRPKVRRSVSISMKRIPGTEWRAKKK